MTSYEGTEKYIFVSYAHKDAEKVVPVLEQLSAEDFRVWYDAGIEAGTEWPEYIANHLMGCDVVLVFMSNAAAASPNCRKEINFALEMGKELLVIYLEDTKMSAGMRLQLNTHQAMFRNRHKSDQTFFSELKRSKLLLRCKEGYVASGKDTSALSLVSQPSEAKPTTYTHVIASVSPYASSKKNQWHGGIHTSDIDISLYSMVHFQGKLLRAYGEEKPAVVSLTVYNKQFSPVFEASEQIPLEPTAVHFAITWVVRDKMGTFFEPGEYTAHIGFENSHVYECKITIPEANTSHGAVFAATRGERKRLARQEKMVAEEKRRQEEREREELRQKAAWEREEARKAQEWEAKQERLRMAEEQARLLKEEKEYKRLRNRRKHPRGLFYALPLIFLLRTLFFSDFTSPPIVIAVLTIVAFTLLLIFTRRYVSRITIVSFLLCTVFLFPYTAYLFFSLLKRIARR